MQNNGLKIVLLFCSLNVVNKKKRFDYPFFIFSFTISEELVFSHDIVFSGFDDGTSI